MAMITRWDPFRELNSITDRMNRLLQESCGTQPREEGLASSFVPAVDIYEDERKFEKDEKEENFHRIERRYGSFHRAFTLPNTLDPERVAADYENGVLKVRIAKKAEAKPKQIKVNVGSGGQVEGKGQAA